MTQTIRPFDLQAVRRDAREHIEKGAITVGYSADLPAVLKMLNDSLATELVCVLRYRRHHFMARGIHSQAVAAEFLAHANEELGHADLLATRIAQLGGEPDFSPSTLLSRSHADYAPGNDLADMIREDLIAERIAIDSYRHGIASLGDKDPTTRCLLESILAMEEEHADDLADLLQHLPTPPVTAH
ncbi:ferritin-like domain-containing protein [Rhodoferax antarcticus]|nr:ferritin-like domain-containing protein [Rhodoferax antarcticus]APW48340.1 bacterioferritin [Rhodoferax antarcticus]